MIPHCSFNLQFSDNEQKRQLYTWTLPNGQYQIQIDYVLCIQRWRSCIQPAKTRPGIYCGSDHQLHIEKFRLKLKKTGKNTRPARNDLNQISYEFAVEVMSRFKELDLVNSVPKELWSGVHNNV